jgi:hypothetical protein
MTTAHGSADSRNTLSSGTILATFVCAAVVLCAVSYDPHRSFANAGYTPVLIDELNDSGARLNTYASLTGSWQFSPIGLNLAPGEQGDLTLRLPGGGQILRLSLLSASNGWIRISISCTSFGGRSRVIANTRLDPSARLHLDQCVAQPDGMMIVRVQGEHDGLPGTDPIVNALDRLEIHRERPLPAVARTYALVTLLLIVVVAVGSATQSRVRIIAVTGFITTLLAWMVLTNARWLGVIPLFGLTVITGPILMSVVAAILLSIVAPYSKNRALAGAVPGLVLAVLVAIAVALRWEQVHLQLGVRLWPDTETVQLIIRQMTHPYDTDFREPLWVWAGWTSKALVGDTPMALRLVSFIASVCIVPVTYLLGRDYGASKLLGLLAAAMITTHEHLIAASSQGHRTELLILAITAATYFALIHDIRSRYRAVGLAVTSAAMMLTSLSSAVVAGPLILWAAYKHRLRTRYLLAIATIVIITLTPHVLYNYQNFGTYSYFATRLVPVFYRNHEFMVVRNTGCDGCPSRDDFIRDSYSGQPISMSAYLFEMHTTGEVMSRMIDGFRIALLRPGPELSALIGSGSALRYGLYIAGLMCVLLSRQRVILLVFLLALNLTAFVVPLGLELRLLTAPAAIAAFVQAAPLVMACLWLRRRWRGWETTVHSV